jgi:hypothetical protein
MLEVENLEVFELGRVAASALAKHPSFHISADCL